MTTRIAQSILITLLLIISLAIGRALAGETAHRSPSASVGKEIVISSRPPDHEEDPIAAWGDGRALVVWQSTRNGPTRIYGTLVTTDGEVSASDGFPVSTSPADQLFPWLAWGNPNYLVVWQDLRSHKNWEIYGARIDAAGHRLDPSDLAIGTGAGNRRHPVVAWGGGLYFAVWMEERPDNGWDIVGRRVAGDGKFLDTSEIIISAAKGDQTAPVVTWDGKNFFVAWMDGRKDRSQDIYGARIDPEGKVLDPNGIVIAEAPREQGPLSVALQGKTVIAVWVDRRDGANYLLYGARITSDGAVLEPNGVVLSSTPRLHMFPDIACRKNDCLIVWEELVPSGKPMANIQDVVRDVNGMGVPEPAKGLNGAPTLGPIPIAPGALGNHFSRVSTDGQRYLVVWKDYRSIPAANFGRFIDIPKAP